jgi:hypothetical protein
MKIEGIKTLKELAELSAELVKQGVCFTAYKNKDDSEWIIEFSGGY